MTTREEQIQAAERIAGRNEGWTWDGTEPFDDEGPCLFHTSGAYVFPSCIGEYWCAVTYNGHILDEDFDGPEAAVRALGFHVDEGEDGDE
jgi:hypothetical protein